MLVDKFFCFFGRVSNVDLQAPSVTLQPPLDTLQVPSNCVSK